MSQEATARNIIQTFTNAFGLPPTTILNPAEYPILYVDDSQDHRELMEMVFRGTGFPLVTHSGTKDLEKFILSRDIRLIYLDLNLGSKSGLDVLHELKKNAATSSIPVVMLTANNDRETILDAVRSGCDGYVVKPINEALIPKTYEVLEKCYYSGELVRGVVKRYDAGTTLIREGVKQRTLFLIKHGVVQISIQRQGREVTLATLREGDMIGEESFLTGTTPSATATAESEVSVLELVATQDLDQFWHHNFGLREIMMGLAKKLRKANETIALQSHNNYIVARHQGVDLQHEALYSELWRLLSLMTMIFTAEGAAGMSIDRIRARLESLASYTPLNLETFLSALIREGFLHRHDLGDGVVSKDFALETAWVEAMIGKLEEAKRKHHYVVLNHIAENMLKLLDALHPDKSSGVPCAVPSSIVNPTSSAEIKQTLKSLEELGIINFADADRQELRYIPVKLNFFLKWQRVLTAMAPSQLRNPSKPTSTVTAKG